MKQTHEPQILEDQEREVDNLKTLLSVVVLVVMLAAFGLFVHFASHIAVVTY